MTHKSVLFKLSLLSISLLTTSATAITGILPLVRVSYPMISQTLLESLVTIPSLTTFVFTLLSSWVATKIGAKKTVQLGLSIAFITGILPFFVTNFSLLIGLRLLFGVGIGLITPLSISLISLFFDGEERANLLGYQVGTTALGGSLLILLTSILMKNGWNWSFLVYLLIFPIGFLFSVNVPEPVKKVEKAECEIRNQGATKLNATLVRWILLCFFTFLVIWAVQLKLALFFVEEGIGTANHASLLLSLMNLGGLFAGLLFGKLYQRFHKKLLIMGYLLAGGSIFFLSQSNSLKEAFFWGIFFNFIYSFTGPYIITKVNQHSARSLVTLSTALVSVSMTASQFLTPFFWNSLGRAFGNDSAKMILVLAGMLASLIGCIIIGGASLKKWKNKRGNSDA